MESSPINRLSPELRNYIYELVFTSQYATTLQHGSIQHALTKTCRQVRHETLAMFYSRARFNAHLDDGPAIPLARWLKSLGREQCLTLNEVNVWDMHMLNATLHGLNGQQDGERVLSLRGRANQGVRYELRPIGAWLLDRGWYLKDLVIALHSMGLGLQVFRHILPESEVPKLTSHFAIIPLSTGYDLTYDSNGTDVTLMGMLRQLGFDRAMLDQVSAGRAAVTNEPGRLREIRARKGRRDFFLMFNGKEFVSVRQTFVPHNGRLHDWS